MEVYQDFGNDLVATSSGDLQTADGIILSNQAIIRRLVTIPITVSSSPDYLQNPTYGAGLPQFIGQLNDPKIYNQIKSLITSQMYLENTVSQIPPPDITLTGLPNRLEATIIYTYAPTNKQVVLTLTV